MSTEKVAGASNSRLASATGSKFTAGASTTTSRRNRRGLLGSDEFMAAAIGDTAWLRQSLKGGKNPASFDKNGLSAIHLASLHARIECLKLLVEKYHVNVNLSSSTGWRPIHLCINNRTGKRALECLVYLLDMGADPSVPNEDLMTPTHQAAIEGSVKCLEVLLARGADISQPDCNGHLPLDYAKIWGHRKCARILASETWKREKESELSKLNELQQMKQLKDIVDENERQDQQAYRDLVLEENFSEWLDNKGLKEKQTPRKLSTQRDSISLGQMANQLYQTNSRRKLSNAPRIEIIPEGSTKNVKSKSKEKTSIPKTLEEKRMSISVNRGDEKRMSISMNKPNEKRMSVSVNKKPSTERMCKGKKKPPIESVPKIKVPVVEISGQPHKDKMILSTHPVPDLPQEVIDKILLEKLSPHERPLSFKCKNIIDAQHKRLYDESCKHLQEVYAHISNDTDSQLFPGPGTQGTSSKSNRSSQSDSFDTQRIADALKHIAKPYRFPQIHGEDYTYAFEVL